MKNRTVVEIMILCFTIVVSVSIMAMGATVTVIELLRPETDTSDLSRSLASLLSGIVGGLLGLIAGKSDTLQSPPGDPK